MKTPKFLFLVMFSPAALLLSNCNSIGSTQPPVAGSRASPPLLRQHVSSGTMIDHGFVKSLNWEQPETSENESDWLRPLELTINVPERSYAVEIAPLVVTATTMPDFVAEDWPSDVMDAQLKAAWITPKAPESAYHSHATEDSVSEWLSSLR